MARVAQLPCERADASKVGDNRLMVHAHDVQSVCTLVNVECVDHFFDKCSVIGERTSGQIIRELQERSGFSVRAFAKACGYSHASGIQRYVDLEFDGNLRPDVAKKMAEALTGKGAPPIEAAEVYALVGMPTPNAVVQPFEGASLSRMKQDLPILGTALGADKVVDGFAVEQTYLYSDEIIGHARRPVILDGRADAYGIYVQGSSMDPVFEDGALILVETKRPPRIGDNVVVYLRRNGADQEADHDADDGVSARTVLVKRLVRRSGTFVEMEQHNPKLSFKIAAIDVLKMHRVMTLADLLS